MDKLTNQERDAAWALGEAIAEATEAEYPRTVILPRNVREEILRYLLAEGWVLIPDQQDRR